jgi:hypothetical protein
MSLNSLQDDMSRRAASMAAMAKGARNPQEIQAIQQRLVAGVQNGTIQPYVGIPLIQDLSKKLAEAKAKMAQSVAGAGMPQPPQGGAPIAQQVMAQAAQQDQGVEALPSNLPQSYTGGGIIAFEDGGQVERYQNKGYVYETPYDRMNRQNRERAAAEDAARLTDLQERGMPTMSYGEQMGNVGNALVDIPLTALKTLVSAPGYGFSKDPAATPAVAPTATPAANPYNPADATRRSMFQGQGQPPTPGGPGSTPGGINFKMPVLQGFTPSDAPTLEDYHNITKNLPTKLRDVSEKAVKATQEQLEEFDKPLEAKGARLEGRDAQLAKDTEISRYLAVLKGGLATLGGTSKNAAENIGKGFNVGVDEAIRGEAANRAAKDRLEDAKDRFDEQKIAAKKGNYQAAQQAGQRAADDERQATQLTMTGAHYGNTEALNRYQTEQQGKFQQASLDQSGKLGIAGLGLQAQQLAQTGAFQNKQLAAMEQRYAAMDKQAQARMQQVRAGAVAKFNETMAPQVSAQLMNLYGKNWRVGTDPKSLEAQMKFKQAQNAYIMDALGQHDASMAAKDSSEY